jgi:hypothetical protein
LIRVWGDWQVDWLASDSILTGCGLQSNRKLRQRRMNFDRQGGPGQSPIFYSATTESSDERNAPRRPQGFPADYFFAMKDNDILQTEGSAGAPYFVIRGNIVTHSASRRKSDKMAGRLLLIKGYQ